MNPSHREHDELLIVRAATAETDAVDATLAERQLASCADCRALLADIQAVRASTVATVLRVPPRPRSFRVPADELERLVAPAWRRRLSGFGMPRFDLLRPVATAVAGLGLVVMVAGSMGPFPVPGPAGFTKDLATQQPAEGLAAPTPTPAEGRQDGAAYPPAASPTAPSSSPAAAGNGSSSSGQPSGPDTGRPVDTAAPAPPIVPPATLAGGLVAAAGALLLLLHTAARRLAGR